MPHKEAGKHDVQLPMCNRAQQVLTTSWAQSPLHGSSILAAEEGPEGYSGPPSGVVRGFGVVDAHGMVSPRTLIGGPLPDWHSLLLSNAPNGGRATGSISPETADKVVANTTQGWARDKLPALHDSLASAPKEVQQAVRDTGGNETTGGITYKGRVHIYTSLSLISNNFFPTSVVMW